MKRSVFTPLALASTAVLVLTACGGGDSADAPTDADLVVKGLDSLVFDATAYTATAGEVKIAFVNAGNINHTLLVVADQKQIGEKLAVGAGGEDEGTYNLAAGTYVLFCDVPGHGNMKSTLTVS